MNNKQKAASLHKLADAAAKDKGRWSPCGPKDRVHKGLCEAARWEEFCGRLTKEEYTFLDHELADQVSTNYKDLSPWWFGYLTKPHTDWPLRAQFAHDLAVAYEMKVLP